MSQLFTATDVTATNGNKFIQVNTGDDVSLISPNSWIQIGNGRIQEVKTVNTSATPQTIELFDNWNGGSGSGQYAISAPTAAEIKAAAEEIRQLRVTYEGIAGDVNVSAAANSIAKRDSNGRLKATAPVASDDVVNRGYLGTAATRDVTTSRTDSDEERLMRVSDFGLGERVTTPYPSDNFDDGTVPCGFYRLINGVPSTGTRPEGFSDYAYCQVQTYDVNSKLQTVVDVSGKKAYRHLTNANTNEWVYEYNSGNTNFNEFEGDVANDYVLPNSGKGRSTNIVRFLISLNSVAAPSSITTSPLTQFVLVRESDQAVVSSSISNIGLSATSSRKVLVLEIAVADSVITVDENYALRCNVGGTFIEVNY